MTGVFTMEDYEYVLKALSENNKQSKTLLDILDLELSLPNIPMQTLGGEVFWTNIAEYNGWKLQQNMVLKNARILDSNNVRIAWGTINGMQKALDRMIVCMKKYEKPEKSSDERMQVMQELKQLKELLDMGAISQEEFKEKKDKLMRKI